MKQFDQDQIVIGHNAEVHLDLDSDQVSSIHCLVEKRDNGFYLCDLGSQTGTFKNGQAILDEMISSGDEIHLGPFKISFFVGVPKPQSVPSPGGEAAAVTPPAPVDPLVAPVALEIPESSMPPAAVVKTEEIKVTPALPVEMPHLENTAVTPPPAALQSSRVSEVSPEVVGVPTAVATAVMTSAPARPEIKKGRASYKKTKKGRSYAPPSEIQNLKTYLKPGKGTTVEVIVAWKERILTNYHFRGNKPVRINNGDRQVSLPEGLLPRGYPLLDLASGLKVNTTAETQVELISSSGNQSLEEMVRNGKAQRGGQGHNIRVDQNEMLCLSLPGGNLSLFVRYSPQAPVVPLMPSLMLTGSEMTGVVMSIVMVGLLALYVSATTPKDWDQNKQEEVQRVAQIIFNNPPPAATPKPTPPPPEPPPPPPAVQPTPTPTPQKVIVADQNRDAQKKGPVAPGGKNQVAARANEVAPKPNAQDRTKKFTSTRQGGAVKTGETAGANAQSAKDLSKVGLFSAFGGGGNRANIDKAYSGAGEVLGMADKATGTSGFNEDRAGDDLGSKFKDAGAGGKGTATQGIAGVGTKGRSSGQSAYGASEGFGSKSSVAIEGGGFEESFDATIDKEAIRRVIRAKLHEVKSCYERVLNTKAKGVRIEGKVVLGWEIIAKGQARNVKVKSSTLGNAQVENCIRDRLASWIFPDPPPGMTAEVQAYPFVLNQTD